jgi:transcription-repair coupling factor (superfamily II helicase)
VNPEVAAVFDLAARDPALRSALAGLEDPGRRLALGGLSPAAAAVLIPALIERSPDRKIVLLVPGEKDAEQFRSDLAYAVEATRGGPGKVLLFPSLEADPYQELAPHLRVSCERVQALRALREPGETVVIAPVRALIFPLAAAAAFDVHRFDLRLRQPLRPDDLSGFLLGAGYLRVDLVTTVGEFSRRGGIIDFHPPDGSGPVRVEFWGEEIESLRTFDPATQRSTGSLATATAPPVREYPWDAAAFERLRAVLEERRAGRRKAGATLLAGRDDLQERLEALAAGGTFPGFEACVRLVEPRPATLFDYAPRALLAAWDEEQILSELERVYVEMHASLDLSEDFSMPPPEELLTPRETLRERAGGIRVRLSELALQADPREAPLRVPCAPPRTYRGRLQDLAADLKQTDRPATTLFLMESAGRIERLAEVLQDYGLAPRTLMPGSSLAAGPPASLLIAAGRLSQGFVMPASGLQVLTEKEVFGEHLERDTRRRKVAAFSPDFRDLKVGDLVVHLDHGIGRYAGIVRVGDEGAERDFMLLTYDGNDKLYVPIDRLDLVQRYSGVAGHKPRLDRLGGLGWERTKKKVRKAMEEMAKDLLELYAARAAARGHAFPPDTPWQREFEDAFPYQATPDQERSVREVSADMEREAPMDRLICGDVGFGKTEVAMRAAFKAVMDGKQVAVLCPTTVLAVQHRATFRERFSSWPVTIEMISRFRTPREQKVVVKAVAEGKVDILIGTHRLLSRDVGFKRLGLLVVDEEQRFGVTHKEAIKGMKRDVDVLTLTATPIPRTLQMSLAGIRDMSVIETPPENRLAIQTAIVPFREGVIATALRNEMNRGGQVYFVHNRVESIGSMANFLRRLVPEARIGIAHGQMGEKMLERTMLSFLQGEFDVLLATTIIENGLDIPRVNTIVVNRADRFGLAQLYQLRGRVGRSDRRAYAYLLVPPRKALTPIARRRLKALQEFTDLGSGFRIAAMDLEIRGAGNLLGAEQSGHIAAIGFEMYCQLLERTVREMKGETPPPEFKTQINLGVDLRIPEDYIPDFSERLVLYREISVAPDDDHLGTIRDRASDLYGEFPRQGDTLIALASLRLVGERLRIRSIDFARGVVQIRFAEDSPLSPDRIVELAARRPGVRLTPDGVLRVNLDALPEASGDPGRIEEVRRVLQAIGSYDSLPKPKTPSAVLGPSDGDR